MMPFSLFLALKYLRPKRSFISVVTSISVLGVLLGVAILVIVLSVMTGFGNMWREKILSFKPHLMVRSYQGVILDVDPVVAKIRAVPGVTGCSPAIETRALVRYEGRVAAPIVLGIDPEAADQISQVPSNIVMGAFLDDEEQAVVGIDLAMRLGCSVGSRILVYSPQSVGNPDEMQLPTELEIVGIFDMGMRDFDAEFLITTLWDAQDMVGIEAGAMSIYAMTEDPLNGVDQVGVAVAQAIGFNYNVSTWQEIDRALFDAIEYEKTMMFILLVFIAIVAIFCVTNTLIVITVHKTHEIGLLKALGFPTWKVTAVFVWHGWIQCAIGTGAGIATGLFVLANLGHLVDGLRKLGVPVFEKEIYGFDELPHATTWQELALIAAIVMGFSTFASILPAWRAARLDPVEALRQE
jgi:lipoprotein-releasing system permease protein